MFSVMIQIGDRVIRVEGDGRNEVKEEIGELEKKYLESGTTRTFHSPSQETQVDGGSDQTRAEFFRKAKPKSNTEVVIVFGYYRERLSKEDKFTQKDILSDYQGVHKAKPANIADVFVRAKKLGWIRKLDSNGWNISQSGEKKVVELIEKE